MVVALKEHCSPDQQVALDLEYSAAKYSTAARPRYFIDLTIVSDLDHSGCVVAVKKGDGDILITAQRFKFGDGSLLPAQQSSEITDFVPALLANIWKTEATRAEDIPLPAAMIDAYNTERERDGSWQDADCRLAALMKDNPNDNELKLMYATHLHSKYVLMGADLFYKGTDSCREDEQEIERLVLETLPFAQTRPEYAIIAAKLLYFLNPNYREMATCLAETLHENGTKVASSLAIIGQIRSFHGQFSQVYQRLEQVRNLAKERSEFHIYVLVLQCQMMLAANDREGLKRVRRELYRVRPATILLFEPIFTDPERPSIRAKALIMVLSQKRARAILQHIFT